MTRWPTINREPVRLPNLAGYEFAIWETLLELADLHQDWTLIGGQMVFLHALEHRVAPVRVSADLDVLVNARVVTGGTREFVQAVERRGFELDGWSFGGLAHRYRRGPVSLDVLAPEGLGPRTDITTTPPGRTLQVSGGTQAQDRTELVPVIAGYSKGLLPRPSVLGAVIIKAEAVGIGDAQAHWSDLALLLSLIDHPASVREQLTRKDRSRLRRHSAMLDRGHYAWSLLPGPQADRGHATLNLLVNS